MSEWGVNLWVLATLLGTWLAVSWFLERMYS